MPKLTTPADRAKKVILAEPERLEQMIAEEIEEALYELLERIATHGYCKGCGAAIFWTRSVNNKNMPLNRLGAPHWADCPQAAQFKRKKEAV